MAVLSNVCGATMDFERRNSAAQSSLPTRGRHRADVLSKASDMIILMNTNELIMYIVGPLSTVYRAVHRITSKLYSVKSIDLQKYSVTSGLTRTDVDNEIEICAVLKHPFLCELKDVIAGEKAVHMVFEFLDGDDICFEIVKRASAGFVYSEAVASKDNSAPLKLTGFGVSLKLPAPAATVRAGRVGVSYFMAPEVVSDVEYGTKADMWSAGVLLYILLCGRLPFVGTRQGVYEGITEGRYSHHGGTWQQISDSAKDLLIRLLTVNP
ncbi:unnamed protein product, partial [Wuchereria bancrofti]